MKLGVYLALISIACFSPLATARGQNVSGYRMMPDPTLFLLREPALHRELQLSEQQRKSLIELNERYDGVLLSTRNMPTEEGQPKVAQVFQKSREFVTRSFSGAQQLRLRQILYRLRGISFVLLPTPSAELQLSDEQRSQIETAVKKAQERVSELQTGSFQGPEKYENARRGVMAARKEEYDTIMKTLTSQQRQKLSELAGPPFDDSKLGRVSFKAPELDGGTSWINSPPLSLEDLRGKVVALHFYAFG